MRDQLMAFVSQNPDPGDYPPHRHRRRPAQMLSVHDPCTRPGQRTPDPRLPLAQSFVKIALFK